MGSLNFCFQANSLVLSDNAPILVDDTLHFSDENKVIGTIHLPKNLNSKGVVFIRAEVEPGKGLIQFDFQHKPKGTLLYKLAASGGQSIQGVQEWTVPIPGNWTPGKQIDFTLTRRAVAVGGLMGALVLKGLYIEVPLT